MLPFRTTLDVSEKDGGLSVHLYTSYGDSSVSNSLTLSASDFAAIKSLVGDAIDAYTAENEQAKTAAEAAQRKTRELFERITARSK